MNIEKMFQNFICSQKAVVNFKESTISTYSYHFNAYIKPYFQKNEINANTVRDYTKFLLFKLNEKSVSDVLTLFSSILRQNGMNIEIYKPKFKIPVIQGLSDNEWEDLENYCVTHMDFTTFGILLTLYTGVRPGELCACQKQNLDLSNQFLKILETLHRIKNLDSNAKSKTKIIIDDPKSFKGIRNIPIIDDLIAIALNLYKDVPNNAFLLTGKTDHYMEVRTLENRVKKVFNAVGIDGSPYTLRHAFATRYYYLTDDIKTLAELLGHANIQTTYRYIFTSDEKKRQGVNCLVSLRKKISSSQH